MKEFRIFIKERALPGVLSLILAGVLFAAPGAAQDEGIPKPKKTFEVLKTVTLDVKERPLADIVEYIRENTGANIILDKEIEDTVTIKLVDVPWREALELIVERTDCVLIEKGANILKIEKPPRITFKFKDAELTDVIESIAKISGANIVVAPEVHGKVNVNLVNIPWRDALGTIVKTLGFTVVEEDRDIYRIVSPSSLKEQLETRVFELKYIRPPETYVATIQTAFAEGKPVVPKGDPEKDFTLLKALQAALSEKGKLTYILRTNSIIVKDTKPKLDEIEKIILKMDVPPGQILIDVKFITTSNTDFFDFGVDIGDNGIKVSMSGGMIPHRLPFTLGHGGWEDKIIAAESERGPFGYPDADLAGGSNVIKFGTMDFTQAIATFRVLKKDQKTQVTQAPKLIALDNQEATIFVGEKIRFAQRDSVEGQAGGVRTQLKEADNSPVETGFQLLFIPHVIRGTNKIMLTVIPEVESLSGTTSDIPGFDQFNVAGDTIDLPRVASSTLVTKMMLESGETAVIGGLMQERDQEQINKIPILGDIPFIGYLFKNRTVSKIRDNLIVFITARIIPGSDEDKEQIRKEIEMRQKAIEDEFQELFEAEASFLFEEKEEEEEEAPVESPEETSHGG